MLCSIRTQQGENACDTFGGLSFVPRLAVAYDFERLYFRPHLSTPGSTSSLGSQPSILFNAFIIAMIMAPALVGLNNMTHGAG